MKNALLIITYFVLFIFGAIMLNGCGSDDDPVIAKVDGEKITARELNDIFNRSGQKFASFDEELQNRRQILDSLIIQRLLIKEAYKKNIDESEEVKRIVLGNKDRFLLDAFYKKMVIDPVQITDEDVKDFYNKLEYKVQASHILVHSKELADSIIEKLKEGESFENLALQYSVDPSASQNRGDLGYFVWGQMDPVFLENVFKLNPGETSAPFETRYGWHIARMTDRAPNELRDTYDKMYTKMRNALESMKRSKRLDEYTKEVKAKYPIHIDTVTCDYLMHKRASLYPPTLLETLPKNDFDLSQLDRDERELVLATWDGGQMTLGGYLGAIKQLKTGMRPDFDDYDGLADVIFNLSAMDILEMEARRSGMEDEPGFKDRIKRFTELTMADIMENDSIQYPGEADEGEIRQYYDDNQSEFAVPEKIHVYEIMFNDYATAKTYVNKINSLDRFKSLASQYTERSGKRANGGDLGWIEQRYYPAIFKVAKETPIGKVGGPIAMGNKTSIIFVADIKPETIKDFFTVKQSIKEKLDKLRRRMAFEEWVKEHREKASIDINESNLRASIDKSQYEQPDASKNHPVPDTAAG
nr:peptidylprolyl isomerase [candidate division Zixibacteria bacterium]